MKRFLKRFRVAAIASAVLSSGTSVVRADFVQNGEFGAGTIPSAGYKTLNAGDNSLAGWSIDSGSIDVGNAYFDVPGGVSNWVDLDGNSVGSISQSMSGFNVTDTYELDFLLAANPDGDPQTKYVTVSVLPPGLTNQSSSTVGNNSAKNAGDWIQEKLTFHAGSPNETLNFQSDDPANPGFFGPVIADVKIIDLSTAASSVPLPKSAGVGFGMLGIFGAFAGLRKRLTHSPKIA